MPEISLSIAKEDINGEIMLILIIENEIKFKLSD